ncbi:hypothetical protein M2336_002174 [Sphingobium sp. B1D7B]|uniref:hypothetical protein n=1 Tax=unclassified Sphingobium TaxID=2611147 RepID=UPI002224F5E9|nr:MULTISPECIES: hypothetical protein [unclassified Sphingobium]MCW2405545.1 hypothetical protein [Sphingobium sp. B1D7B]
MFLNENDIPNLPKRGRRPIDRWVNAAPHPRAARRQRRPQTGQDTTQLHRVIGVISREDLCAKTNEIAFACEPIRHDEGLIEATGFACTASFSRWHKTSRASPILRDIDFARYSSLRHWKSTDEKTRKFLIEQEILMTLSESVASMPRWTLACGPVAPLVPIPSKPRRTGSRAGPMSDIAARHNR